MADMVSALVDGGIVVSKVVRDKGILPKQIMLYCDFVRAVFLGTCESFGNRPFCGRKEGLPQRHRDTEGLVFSCPPSLVVMHEII